MSNKRKNLETWREELVGKQFGRLTVIDVQPHIRKSTGNKDGYEAVCECTCGSTRIVILSNLLNGNTQSCGCFSVESSKKNLDKAHSWFKEHPDETKQILENSVQAMLKWQADYSEKAKEQKLNAIKQANKWQKEHPDEVKQIKEKRIEKAKEWRECNRELMVSIARANIHQAHIWHKKHVKESNEINKKLILASKEWRDKHPNECKEHSYIALQKAILWHKEHRSLSEERLKLARYKSNLKRFSKEEKELYNFLCTLGFSVERQILIENHYFDFRINNFLIEYHGSVYHYTEFCNQDNPKSKEPPSNKKDKNYHVKLRNLALRNNYTLIQVWDFDWKNRKEFIKNLIKDQVSGTADYRNYVEKDLLNNDYGFSIEGELIEPTPVWVSTGYKNIVNEEYTKGRVLVYNSGFTKL